VHHADRFYLHRLQHRHFNALFAELADYSALIPAVCLDAHAHDAGSGERDRKRLATSRRVGHMGDLGVAVNGGVEGAFGHIDPRRRGVRIRHLR
jgi:hypothetical protein